jgi:hypothetical protein
VLDLGHPDLNAAFLNGTGPTAGSSTVLIAEPGTRYTYLALRFLAAGRKAGETTLMVSTKEDQDALRRICAREPTLATRCLDSEGAFQAAFGIYYLHPEFLSPGKLTWDLIRLTAVTGSGQPATRLAFDNFYRLQDRFPLIREQGFLIPALLDLLRYRSITPLFIDLVPPGSAKGRNDFNPASYMTTFDNVLHLFLGEDGTGTRPMLRILKSTANEFVQTPVAIDYRKV